MNILTIILLVYVGLDILVDICFIIFLKRKGIGLKDLAFLIRNHHRTYDYGEEDSY